MLIFHSNCSSPPQGVAFVAGMPLRSTLDILWSCLAIILLCTYSVLHLNVPLQSTPQNSLQKVNRAILRAWRKVKWMAMNITAPEWTFSAAFNDLMIARQLQPRFAAFTQADRVEWSIVHTHLANMGGFAISFDNVQADTSQASILERFSGNYHCAVGRRDSDSMSFGSTGYDMSTFSARSSISMSLEQPEYDMPSSSTRSSISGSLQQPGLSRTSTTSTRPHDPIVSNQGSFHDCSEDIEASESEISHSPICVCSWEVSLEKLSKYIGTIGWQLDEMNAALATLAYGCCCSACSSSAKPKNGLRMLCGNIWILDAHQLLMARELGIIKRLPAITQDDIADHDKSNIAIKSLALAQISWLIIQIAARLANNLSITQLEILTLAFAGCSIITYLMVLGKPQDVQTTHIVEADHYPKPKDMNQLAKMTPVKFFSSPLTDPISPWMPNSIMHYDQRSTRKFAYANICAMVIFGCIHCSAWNLHFPSNAESLLWRICSIVTIVTWPILGLEELGMNLLEQKKLSRKLMQWVFFVENKLRLLGIAMFVLARLFITVESFRSLTHQPPSAYTATWAVEVPHVS